MMVKDIVLKYISLLQDMYCGDLTFISIYYIYLVLLPSILIVCSPSYCVFTNYKCVNYLHCQIDLLYQYD